MVRRLAALAAVLMVTLGLPAALGAHLSAGGHAAIGTQAEESEDRPSVPGDDVADPETMYGVGTTHPEDCYRAEGQLDPAEAQAALTSRGFCGQLVYNVGSGYERPAPPDQDHRDPLVGTFDVQRTYHAGSVWSLALCQPMCDDGDGGPQNTTWRAAHTAGEAAGLTEGPQEADEGHPDGRFNVYIAQLHLRSAPGLVQEETGAWQGDGWTVPFASERWIGWLLDDEDEPISQTRLLDHVQAEDEGHRPAVVCGFAPGLQFTSVVPRLCDVHLEWIGPDGDAADDPDNEGPFAGTDDPCRAPTYVCGPTEGPYWQGEATGVAAYTHEGEEFTVWHWVVAPHPADCAVADPGFDPDPEGAEPYLAHDLDVYTPATALADGPRTSPANTAAYARAAAEAAPGHLEPPDPAAEQAQRYLQDDIPERNHLGAEGYAIDDDSRQAIDEDRSFDGDCHELISSESRETLDPWVNVLDAGVVAERSIEARSALAEEGLATPTAGLYGTPEERDEDNDPTAGRYATEGHVGVFTDKDDDGTYDQVPGERDTVEPFGGGPFDPSSIHTTGAYPMAWDMHVDLEAGQPTIDHEAGCQTGWIDSLTAAMDEAGYGPNTGLVQAIHLGEPTVFYERSDLDETTPVVADVAILGSQAVHELWD